MKKVIILLTWMLLGEWPESTGRMCTIITSQNNGRPPAVQRECDICDFSHCCMDSNCITCRDAVSLCHISPTPQPCLVTVINQIRENSSILCKICSNLRIPCPSCLHNQWCTNSPPIDPDTPTTSASPTLLTSSPATESQIKGADQSRENIAAKTLGVLVGVLLVLLVVVTIGWVWTCWTMRQKERNKTNNSDQVRTIHNTAYGMIAPINNSATGHTTSRNSEQPSNTVDTRNAGGLQDRDIENYYHLMSREAEGESGEEHEYHVLEGPGRGDGHVGQNKELGTREVEENEEEHEYQVLEGPMDVDPSKEMGKREVGGAKDYEVPLPLKEE